MSNYNYVNRVLIGDGTQSGAITSLPQIKKGDLVFLDEKGNVISTNAASAALPKFSQVVLASGIGDGIAILSSPIQGNYVSKYEGKAFRAPQEQVAYIGYNGTAGTGLDINASTEYRLRLHILDDHRFNGQRQTFSDYNYVGGADASADKAIDEIICYTGVGGINRLTQAAVCSVANAIVKVICGVDWEAEHWWFCVINFDDIQSITSIRHISVIAADRYPLSIFTSIKKSDLCWT